MVFLWYCILNSVITSGDVLSSQFIYPKKLKIFPKFKCLPELKGICAGLFLVIMSLATLAFNNISVSASSNTISTDQLTETTNSQNQDPLNIACARNNYNLPDTLDSNSMTPGYHIKIDPPEYYKVYGNSISAIQGQIAECSPISDTNTVYSANTGTALSTFYTYSKQSNNNCSLTSAMVSLHINMILPDWQNTTVPVDQKLLNRWSRFSEALKTHELGHVNISKSYGQKLYSKLSSLGHLNCDQIDEDIRNTIDEFTSAMDRANLNYDNITKHGTTEGAVLS